MKNLVMQKLASGRTLSFEESCDMQSAILNGNVVTDELVKIFRLLDRALTADEFHGFFRASQASMVKVDIGFDALDTCGTGGDGLNTFNISTASAIVCASLGVPVAKHGNRSSSSACGSADVLEALGVNINLSATQVKACIEKCGIVFMFARNFHPAFKNAAQARKIFGKKTYFNFLGPLLNPVLATHRVLGVSDTSMVSFMGNELMNSGVKKAWLVHAQDGMDEISTFTETQVHEFTPEKFMKIREIIPQALGLSNFPVSELLGAGVQENATIIKNVLKSKATTAQTTAVLLNAAAGLLVFSKANSLHEGIELAKEALESGKAWNKLLEFIKVSNSL